MTLARKVLIASVLALVVGACGTGDEAQQAGTPDGTLNTVTGACAPDAPDCDDTLIAGGGGDEPLFVDGESRDGASPSSSGFVVDGGLSIGDALATDATGTIAIHGFVFIDGGGARLCDVLLESMPPQCGGDAIALATLDGVDTSLLQESQGVQWTNRHVTLLGKIVDGVFVTDPLTSAQSGQTDAGGTEVTIYLLGGPEADPNAYECSDVVPVARTIRTQDLLAGAIEELLNGPTPDERLAGYDSWFSSESGWELESVEVSEGVAHIAFGEDSPLINNASTSCGSMSFLAQLDSTVTQFPMVDRAVYSFGSDADAFYGWLQRSAPDA